MLCTWTPNLQILEYKIAQTAPKHNAVKKPGPV